MSQGPGFDDRVQPNYKVLLCSIHDKERTRPNMVPDGNGGWKCKMGSECKQGGPRSMDRSRGPRNWDEMGPRRNDGPPQWGRGGGGQRGGMRGGMRDGMGGGMRGNFQGAGRTGGWGDRSRMGGMQGMHKRNGAVVRHVPNPDLNFSSTTLLCIDFEFIHGVARDLKPQLTRGETFPYPVAGTIVYWNKGDEVMLFQGRIAVPNGVDVIDDVLAREKAGLNPPWSGVSLDTIQKLLSPYGFAASAAPLEGMGVVGHSTKYYLQSIGVEWPSSLVFDLTELYQAEGSNEMSGLPIKLEDAFSQEIRPQLPGDPLDPVIKCKMSLELYLFLQQSSQNNNNLKRKRSDEQAPTDGQFPMDSFPPPAAPSQALPTEGEFSAPAPASNQYKDDVGSKAPATQTPQSWGPASAPESTWGPPSTGNWTHPASSRGQSRW